MSEFSKECEASLTILIESIYVLSERSEIKRDELTCLTIVILYQKKVFQVTKQMEAWGFNRM